MTFYAILYSYDGERCSEYFKLKRDARKRYAELHNEEKVRSLELEENKILRPSADTILRILNNEGYVLQRTTILKGSA